MLYITIVGAGTYGTRIADKYKKFETARVKAVVSRHKPTSESFSGVPFFRRAAEWKKKFGTPDKTDVFDICVHHGILIDILESFIAIGAKNFILPKPISLNKKDLLRIQVLASRHKLKILVASQWHYSSLVSEIADFVKKNKSKISSVDIVFSRSFEASRKHLYTTTTAFLPHILQILRDTGVFENKAHLKISHWSEQKISLRYRGKTEINIESDLTSKEKIETLKVSLVGDTKPSLVANFSGVLGAVGFVTYPSVTVRGKKRYVKEDVLEKMIDCSLDYFGSEKDAMRNMLTLEKYLPVAQEEVRIIEQASKLVVVIGAGIFGTLSALEIAKKGYHVLLLEKESRTITGASLVNQCRVHMGYHYPRDVKTARESLEAKKHFEKVFGKAVIKNVDNHYLIAKEGSLITPKNFLAFCKKLKLPYKEAWPVNTKLAKDKIALSLKVPEPIFDADAMREILAKKLEIEPTPSVSLIKRAEVTAIQQNKSGYDVVYGSGSDGKTIHCAAIVNATYSNLNRINKLAGFPLDTYQYELCEVPIAKTPWKNTGWAIMDGPFFGIMPFGFSKNHLLYDVELSVLERMVGELPKFKFDIEYYNDDKRRAERFDAYKKKWLPYAPEIAECESVSSMYVTRMVLPKKEKTDGRPTMLDEVGPGFWQIFSGKITTSVPCAAELAILVNKFLKKK